MVKKINKSKMCNEIKSAKQYDVNRIVFTFVFTKVIVLITFISESDQYLRFVVLLEPL